MPLEEQCHPARWDRRKIQTEENKEKEESNPQNTSNTPKSLSQAAIVL
jgi:hypothetical protein